jgi:hypothetical protein
MILSVLEAAKRHIAKRLFKTQPRGEWLRNGSRERKK